MGVSDISSRNLCPRIPRDWGRLASDPHIAHRNVLFSVRFSIVHHLLLLMVTRGYSESGWIVLFYTRPSVDLQSITVDLQTDVCNYNRA